MALNKKDLVFGILYIVLGKQIYLWLSNMGIGVRFNNHHPGQCKIVPGLQCGAEKISVSRSGLAFITNGHRAFTNCNTSFVKGSIYLFDFNNPENGVLKLDIKKTPSKEFLETFDPHGMDIYENGGNLAKVYVINHANNNESVEVFQYDFNAPGQLVYVSTIQNENFVCLNDITLINEHEFYVTNFAKYCHSDYKIFPIFEIFFGMNTGNILYYKQGHTAIAAQGSVMNGIAKSPDEKFIYCVSQGLSIVIVYKRGNGGSLKLVKQIALGYSPDNVYVDQQSGNMFIGLHKDTWGYIKLGTNKTEFTSAAALKIEVPTNYEWRNTKVTEILHDNGKDFVSVVSSAVHYNGQYLFGTVFHKLGYCVVKGKRKFP